MPDDEARHALAALMQGGQPSARAFEALRRVVIGYLRSAWPTLDEHAASDTADEAIARVVMRGTHQAGPEPASALPYVLRTARNLQVDSYRRHRDVPGVTDSGAGEAEDVDDKAILRLLDADATLRDVQGALRLAATAGDKTVGHVVAAWLDLAQATDQAPTTRDVGEVVAMAHTTVGSALARFRGYLLQARDDSSVR